MEGFSFEQMLATQQQQPQQQQQQQQQQQRLNGSGNFLYNGSGYNGSGYMGSNDMGCLSRTNMSQSLNHGITRFENWTIKGSELWEGKGYLHVINGQFGQGVVLSSNSLKGTCQVQFASVGDVLEMNASDLSLHVQHKVCSFDEFMLSAQERLSQSDLTTKRKSTKRGSSASEIVGSSATENEQSSSFAYGGNSSSYGGNSSAYGGKCMSGA